MNALEGVAVRTGPKVVNERSGFRETDLPLAGWLWFATAASTPRVAPGFEPASYSEGQVELSTPSDCEGEPSSFRTARIC